MAMWPSDGSCVLSRVLSNQGRLYGSLACFRDFERLSPNEAVPSVEVNPSIGPMKRELGSR
eukprot:7348378-Pyramimonas_sp.AAC.1